MITKAPRAALLALAFTVLLATPAGAQTELSPIEGTWKYDGGRVAVERQEDGSFLGTIIRPTRTSDCVSEIGERLWIDLRLQDDGQYWGQHQYLRSSGCDVVPARGNTAFRVINRAGQTFLRVCFARPDTPDVQPKIAEDGTETDANGGCTDAEFFELLPTDEPKLKDIANLANSRACKTGRRLVVRFKQPAGDALKTLGVAVDGERVRIKRVGGQLRATIKLRKLSAGRHTVRVSAGTARGQSIKGKRRFRTCA